MHKDRRQRLMQKDSARAYRLIKQSLVAKQLCIGNAPCAHKADGFCPQDQHAAQHGHSAVQLATSYDLTLFAGLALSLLGSFLCTIAAHAPTICWTDCN